MPFDVPQVEVPEAAGAPDGPEFNRRNDANAEEARVRDHALDMFTPDVDYGKFWVRVEHLLMLGVLWMVTGSVPDHIRHVKEVR